MEQYRVDLESIPWKTPAVGVRFKAYQRDGKQLRLVEFTKGFVEPDWCLSGHIGLILEGQTEIDFDGEVIVFGPGDGVLISPGEQHKHKVRVVTDVVRAILVEDV